jgi:hypothetical protein
MREIAPASVSFVALEGDCQSTVALACRRDAGQWCGSSWRRCRAEGDAMKPAARRKTGWV